MASRAVGKRAAKVREDDAETGDERSDGGSEANNDDLDSLIEELTGEAEYVVLWRLDGTKQEHVDKVQLSRFNAEYVTNRHGGGDYVMRAYGAKRAGGMRPVKKYREFSIDKSIPPKSGMAKLEYDRAHPSAVTAPIQTPTETKPGAFEKFLDVAGPALATGLVAMLTREKTTDPLLAELIRATVGKGGGDGVDPVELQKLLADERQRGYEQGLKVGELQSGAGGEDGMSRALGESIPKVIDLFQESVRNDREKIAMEKNKPTATARVAATSSTPTAAATPTAGPEWLKLLRQYVPQLVPAMAMLKPEDLAARVLGELPVRIARELAVSCESDSFVEETLVELPELTKTPERHTYFTAVLQAVQDELSPLDDEPGGNDGEEGRVAEATSTGSGLDQPTADVGGTDAEG